MAWSNVTAIFLFHKFTLFYECVWCINIIDIPAAGCRYDDIFHRSFNQERTSLFVGGNSLLQSRFELFGRINTDGLDSIRFCNIRPADGVTLSVRFIEYRAEFRLIVCIFKACDGSECGVVHYDPGTGNAMLYGRRQTGRINAEAAVSRQVDNDFVRCSNLAAKNCGRSESHRSKTGRVMNGSRNGDVKFLFQPTSVKITASSGITSLTSLRIR